MTIPKARIGPQSKRKLDTLRRERGPRQPKRIIRLGPHLEEKNERGAPRTEEGGSKAHSSETKGGERGETGNSSNIIYL